MTHRYGLFHFTDTVTCDSRVFNTRLHARIARKRRNDVTQPIVIRRVEFKA